MAKSKVRFGSYYPGNSVIHNLDPRAKLIGLLIYIIAVLQATAILSLPYCIFLAVLLSP